MSHVSDPNMPARLCWSIVLLQEILEQQQQNKMLTLALQQQLALASHLTAFRFINRDGHMKLQCTAWLSVCIASFPSPTGKQGADMPPQAFEGIQGHTISACSGTTFGSFGLLKGLQPFQVASLPVSGPACFCICKL